MKNMLQLCEIYQPNLNIYIFVDAIGIKTRTYIVCDSLRGYKYTNIKDLKHRAALMLG